MRVTMPSTALRVALTSAMIVALFGAPVAAALTEEAARSAAEAFGNALTRSSPSALRPILPARGKVQLRLARLGSDQGFFSPDQVETLLGEFLRTGKATGFKVSGVELDPGKFARVRGRVDVTDAGGRSTRIGIHLAFQPENERWVLREVRETKP